MKKVHTQLCKIQRVSGRSCLYVTSNTNAAAEAQFIKKLSNTDTEFNKYVAYKKT